MYLYIYIYLAWKLKGTNKTCFDVKNTSCILSPRQTTYDLDSL